MTYKINLGPVYATGPVTIKLGETLAASSLRASAEQLAAAWNRPLDEIKARLLKLGETPSNRKAGAFAKWLMAEGMNPAAKKHFNATY